MSQVILESVRLAINTNRYIILETIYAHLELGNQFMIYPFPLLLWLKTLEATLESLQCLVLWKCSKVFYIESPDFSPLISSDRGLSNTFILHSFLNNSHSELLALSRLPSVLTNVVLRNPYRPFRRDEHWKYCSLSWLVQRNRRRMEKVRLVKQPKKCHSKTTWDGFCVLPSIRTVSLRPLSCY